VKSWIVTTYLHRSKEDNLWLGEELGLSEEALEKFLFMGYEVEVEVEILSDGSWEILGFAVGEQKFVRSEWEKI